MSILYAPLKMIVDFIVGFYHIIEEYCPVLVISCLVILCATLAFRYFVLPFIAETIRLNVSDTGDKRRVAKEKEKITKNENTRYPGGKPKQG